MERPLTSPTRLDESRKRTTSSGYSNGTPVVAAFPTGSTSTGTVSVVDLASFTVTDSIPTGLHPTGMAFWGKKLLVANTYSDTISVINTGTNQVVGTINLGLPISSARAKRFRVRRGPELDRGRPGQRHRLCRALQRQRDRRGESQQRRFELVVGMIPVGYAPSSVVLDAADGTLLVANDKGIGTTGFAVAPPPTKTAENSYGTYHGRNRASTRTRTLVR